MTQLIELSQAELHLADLVRQVGDGEEIIITQAGQPVARLAAATELPRERQPGSAKGLFVVPDDFDAPLEDFRDYM